MSCYIFTEFNLCIFYLPAISLLRQEKVQRYSAIFSSARIPSVIILLAVVITLSFNVLFLVSFLMSSMALHISLTPFGFSFRYRASSAIPILFQKVEYQKTSGKPALFSVQKKPPNPPCRFPNEC